MTADPPTERCGIDTVEIDRMEEWLQARTPEQLAEFFSQEELKDAGEGPTRVARLAARFAAKEACCKLFPRETSLGKVEPGDFVIRSDGYGAPKVVPNENARMALNLYRYSDVSLSMTHTKRSASAVAFARMQKIKVPWFGKVVYCLAPFRREVVLENLRRVFGEVVPEQEIIRIGQAYYGHFVRFLIEFVKLPFQSAKRRESLIRIENGEAIERAREKGKGVLLLTGHFGNWEVSTVAGIAQFEEYKGLFHFVRRPLKPEILNKFVLYRFKKAGFGTLSKKGALDGIMEVLEKNAILVTVFDQHAGRRLAIPVDFFGHEAQTFRSLAVLAQYSGAPVVPAASWREEDGTHVLQFEEALDLIECEDANESILQNTRLFNETLERIILKHPEQWIWMHKRWKKRRKIRRRIRK